MIQPSVALRVCSSRRSHLKTRTSSKQMEGIQKLIDREENLKDKLKMVRTALKTALIESDVYKAVLEDTLRDRDGFTVTPVMAKAHALKVARATYAGDEGEQGGDS